MITSVSPDYVSEYWQICWVLYSSAPLYFFKLEYRGPRALEIWNKRFWKLSYAGLTAQCFERIGEIE